VKCDPVIADFAPTKGHSGRGVRSHIEEKSPNPIAAVARVCEEGGCSRDEYGGDSRVRGTSVAEEEVRRRRACAKSVYLANVKDVEVASELLRGYEATVAGMCSFVREERREGREGVAGARKVHALGD